MEKKDKDTIILNALQTSFEIIIENTAFKPNDQLHFLDIIKNKSKKTLNLIKFNILSNKSNFNITKSKNEDIHLFNTIYKTNTQQKELENNFNELIYFCYRKNFPPIKNPITKEVFLSDSGWGCMIRCTQMILSHAIYKVYISLGYEKEKSIFLTLSYFQEIPFLLESVPDVLIPMMNKFLHLTIEKMLSMNKNHRVCIKSILPPFCIKNICAIGELLGKNAGDWFGDVTMVNILNIINKNFCALEYIEIVNFQTFIVIDDIIQSCFTDNIKNTKFNSKSMIYDNKEYYLKKICVIFVSVRLGLNKIENFYLNPIKSLFTCNECIGFIGGKGALAYYFIGFKGDEFLYLDPHITRECCKNIYISSNIKDYLTKDVHWLKFKELQTSFTIGFLIKNVDDYKDFVDWIHSYQMQQYPCFSSIKNHISINGNEEIDMDIDDF